LATIVSHEVGERMSKKRRPRGTAGTTPTLASMLVLERLVLVAESTSPDRPVRGLGEARTGALRIHSSYWLRVADVGVLRIRIVGREASRCGWTIYYFTVTSRLRARTRQEPVS
jgi:hypothetical protein